MSRELSRIKLKQNIIRKYNNDQRGYYNCHRNIRYLNNNYNINLI